MKEKSTQRRKNYRSTYGRDKIPEGWEVHHIDFDKHNNDLENLIVVPTEVHVAIHQSGYCEREEIENLINIYKTIKHEN